MASRRIVLGALLGVKDGVFATCNDRSDPFGIGAEGRGTLCGLQNATEPMLRRVSATQSAALAMSSR